VSCGRHAIAIGLFNPDAIVVRATRAVVFVDAGVFEVGVVDDRELELQAANNTTSATTVRRISP
jgi:hypothetical protein